MDKMQLKNNIHTFIDQIDNLEVLKEYYSELKAVVKAQKTSVWNTLSEEQKKEVLASFEESKRDENLMDTSEVMKRYDKWQ